MHASGGKGNFLGARDVIAGGDANSLPADWPRLGSRARSCSATPREPNAVEAPEEFRVFSVHCCGPLFSLDSGAIENYTPETEDTRFKLNNTCEELNVKAVDQ